MGKALLVAAFAILALLAFGTQNDPNSSMFWLASSATGYQVVRGGLMAVLLLQIVTNPPRYMVFRATSMIIASSVAIFSLQATYANHMLLLDALSLLASSVAIAVTALERKGSIFAKPAVLRTTTQATA